jgi:F0F1-type ATP synthase membrane subunit c/vacuolar-type H+-ATPase subunit K
VVSNEGFEQPIFYLKDELLRVAILGFALTEAIALFALMMAFLILFAL